MKPIQKKHRVVVTGLGVISSLGIGWQPFWKNLIAGKSGISRIEAFDVSQHDRKMGGEIKNFDPARFMDAKLAKVMGRSSQMAIAATKLALEDAGLDPKMLNGQRTGVCVGTTMGEPQIMEQSDEMAFSEGEGINYEGVASSIFPASSIANHINKYFKLNLSSTTFTTACAAGNYSLARSSEYIASGKSDIMIAGGADALSRIAFSGFGRCYAMSPEKCQPFDKNRKGMMLGEGAGILILESLDHALARGAAIYAEVLGYGMSCDAHHMTNPSEMGVSKAMTKALHYSKITAEEVDYISAHGTGTTENDQSESSAIHRVFGRRGATIPVSSIKSMLGHTMGAASAFESIACCLAIKHQEAPPTINHENNDPNCLVDCVPNFSRKINLKIALNNSQAFGGNNAGIVFRIKSKW